MKRCKFANHTSLRSRYGGTGVEVARRVRVVRFSSFRDLHVFSMTCRACDCGPVGEGYGGVVQLK